MWFCSPGRLVQGKNENLSPSAKRFLRLLTLWTLSDHPYLVEVLHRRPFNRRTSPKTMLQSHANSWVGRLNKVSETYHFFSPSLGLYSDSLWLSFTRNSSTEPEALHVTYLSFA